MNIDDFIKHFSKTLEDVFEGAVGPETRFQEEELWDSLAVLSLIVMIDKQYHKDVTGKEIKSCETVRELYELVAAK